MKTLLIGLSAVLALSSLTACESYERFEIAGDQNGQNPVSGNSACDPTKNVLIQVHISGGAQGDTLTVNAFCGGALLGSSTATDPGNGTTGSSSDSHAQQSGVGTCTPMTTASPTWSYTCAFNQ